MPTFFAENRDVLGLSILLGVSLITNILLHWAVVCPRLYKRGAAFPRDCCFGVYFPELRSIGT